MRIIRIPVDELEKNLRALEIMEKIIWKMEKTGGRDAQVYYPFFEK